MGDDDRVGIRRDRNLQRVAVGVKRDEGVWAVADAKGQAVEQLIANRRLLIRAENLGASVAEGRQI